MSKTKKTKSDNTQYYKDKKEINDFLFHRKKEAIRILNRKVPFLIFPMKFMEIEDISFSIADFGKVFICLHLKDGETEIITSKNGAPVHYDPPGLKTIGPGAKLKKEFIKKAQDILTVYINVLEGMKIKYPEQTIHFGRDNTDLINEMTMSENLVLSMKPSNKNL